jgi:hypothetical protein
MTPIDQIHQTYLKHGVDFGGMLHFHLEHGFVFSTPEFFVMGRPVVRREMGPKIVVYDRERIADAWWIHAFAGDLTRVWEVLPYRLGYVGFERFDNSSRFYPLEQVRRLSVPNYETSLSMAPA